MSHFRLIVAIACYVCVGLTVNAKFPDDPKPCKYGDGECFTKTIEYFLREKNQGDSSINLIKTDPLAVKKIHIKQGAESPVNIDLVFLNNNINGLSKTKVEKVKGFGKDMTKKHELTLRVDALNLVGDYTINGRILVLPIVGSGTSNISLAEDPKPCKYKDYECITKIINYYFKEKSNGDDSINFVDINPLKIKTVALQQGSESPVNVKLIMSKGVIYGLHTGKIKRISGFGKDLSQKHTVVLSFDYLSLKGEYEIEGKILILPITGKGDSNVTLVNPTLTMEFTGTPYKKDDGTYMKINKTLLLCDPKRMIFQFKNLFNGDKALGDNMNLFLNENWKDIFTEIRATMENSIRVVLFKVIAKVFTKYPYDKYFIE